MAQNQEKPKTEQQQKEQDYRQHVEQVTPKYSLPLQMAKAFVTGGIICLLGQFILNYATNTMGLDKETAGAWCSMLLVLLSVLMTGFNLYPKLVEWGGGGALVPITGFANSVASAAIEYQKEGQVFGIGCKIFTITGPVILYGILASWGLGVVYWIGGVMAVILKNNKPFYIVVDFKEYEEIKAIQEFRKRKIAEMTEQLIEDNKEAFLELAK